jgi:hypothetical protein
MMSRILKTGSPMATHGRASAPARNGTTIVIREHDDRLAFKIGLEHTLAGDIEVVAIDEPEDFFHGS